MIFSNSKLFILFNCYIFKFLNNMLWWRNPFLLAWNICDLFDDIFKYKDNTVISSWKFSFQLIFLNLQYKTHHCRVLSPTQALSRTDTKFTNNRLSIQSTFTFQKKGKVSSPAKLLWPLSLLHSAPSTISTATEASVLVLKINLSSAQILSLSSSAPDLNSLQ